MYSVFEHLLQEKGVTRYQVSKATGIPQTTLSTWKTRGTDPSVSTMKRLADYFDVSMEYLVTGKDAMHPQITPVDWAEERKVGIYKDMTEEEISEMNIRTAKFLQDEDFFKIINWISEDPLIKSRIAMYCELPKSSKDIVDMILEN